MMTTMTKKQIDNILIRLQGMEWHFHRVDNGPDEYRCPGYCIRPLYKGVMPELIHDDDCDYKITMDELQTALNKE